MKSKRNVTNVTFDEIRIGAAEESTVTLNRTQIDLMSLVSGDVDNVHPFHLTGETGGGAPQPAGKTESAGSEALLSNIIGTRLPGPGTKILSRDMKYAGSIRAGDTLTARVTVAAKHETGRLVDLDCRVVNQEGRELVSGTTVVEAPKERLSYDDIAPIHLELRQRDAFMNIFRTCNTCEPVTCAVVHPCDRDSLEGALLEGQDPPDRRRSANRSGKLPDRGRAPQPCGGREGRRTGPRGRGGIHHEGKPPHRGCGPPGESATPLSWTFPPTPRCL